MARISEPSQDSVREATTWINIVYWNQSELIMKPRTSIVPLVDYKILQIKNWHFALIFLISSFCDLRSIFVQVLWIHINHIHVRKNFVDLKFVPITLLIIKYKTIKYQKWLFARYFINFLLNSFVNTIQISFNRVYKKNVWKNL